MIPGSRLLSTHIRGKGYALFQVREQEISLRRRSADDPPVDRKWINRTGLVAEGLAAQPYIHLDIRTPFGETVEDRQVREALAESLGPKRDRYRLVGWHVQFVEDTNLGSNHRVFVDLAKRDSGPDGESGIRQGMDAGLALELALEALGDRIAAEKGLSEFQFVLGGADHCYSLLYLNGAPFHVLRIAEGTGSAAADRIRRHREFASTRPGAAWKTLVHRGDPLRDFLEAREVRTEEFTLAGEGEGAAGDSLLHFGLALAARQRDFESHNRVPAESRRRNESIRTRFRFYAALALASLAGAAASAGFALAIHLYDTEAGALRAQAAEYREQVDAIRALRLRKARLESAIAGLRPVWKGPIDWAAVLSALADALPKESGIDGFDAAPGPAGTTRLSFKAWVRDWNQVQSIQKRLAAAGPFSEVALSEQRKDMQTGVVLFSVSAVIGGRK